MTWINEFFVTLVVIFMVLNLKANLRDAWYFSFYNIVHLSKVMFFI